MGTGAPAGTSEVALRTLVHQLVPLHAVWCTTQSARNFGCICMKNLTIFLIQNFGAPCTATFLKTFIL